MPDRIPRSIVGLAMIAVIALVGCAGAATPAPPTTAPATAAPATAAPATAAPATVAPTTVPATVAPATEAPASEAPASEAPASEAPASEAPATAAASPTPVPTAPPTIPTGRTNIEFWSWVPFIQDQVNEFNASQDKIFVTYVLKGAGNAELDNLNTALEAQSGIPDVVQMEYQHMGSYVATNDLADLTQYGGNDVKDAFVPWTWAVSSQGDATFAYPQDAGPMILMCNQKLLDEHNIKVPTTWDEFQTAAAAMHKTDTDPYLSNFTNDQGWFFGMLWQSGAKVFKVDGSNITIDFLSPEVTRVAKLWGDMMTAGVLAPQVTYTPEWSSAIAAQTIACWEAGSWGPGVIEPAAADLSGQWKVSLMPQWEAGAKVNGNYGGSGVAVTAASAHPQEAATFNAWLNADPATALELATGKAALFPVTNSTLTDPKWLDNSAEYWGGQNTHKVMAEAAQQVDTSWQWPPFTSQVYTYYADELAKVQKGEITLEQAMIELQASTVQYAKDQGFTVTEP